MRDFGLKAFRRPLGAKEVERYSKLFAGQKEFIAGAQLVVEAMLQSPNFLFRLDDEAFRLALAKAESKLVQTRNDILGQQATYRQKAADLRSAQAQLSFAQSDYARQAALAAQGYAATAKLDVVPLDRDLTAERTHPLTHADEPEPTLALDLPGVEPTPMINDPQVDRVRSPTQRDLGLLGAAVLDGISQSLLGDAIEAHGRIR